MFLNAYGWNRGSKILRYQVSRVRQTHRSIPIHSTHLYNASFGYRVYTSESYTPILEGKRYITQWIHIPGYPFRNLHLMCKSVHVTTPCRDSFRECF